MKKLSFILTTLLLLLLLTACGKYPQKDLAGNQWNRNWEMLGTVLGVEPPGNDFSLSQNASILTGDDTFYATWRTGEPTKWVNEDNEKVDLYPAQIYLLLYGCADETKAGEAMEDFIAKEKGSYTVRDTVSETFNGQEYTILLYDCGSETNPYNRGASAFAVYRNYVVSAELTCVEGYEGNEHALLDGFLSGCHFSE